MPEQKASTAELRLPLATRVRIGLRHGANWLQLVRFGLVGASGYVVNLAVYALCVHALAIDYRLAATIAFLAAVTNNFWWNRHWTFKASAGNARFQAARFLIVSLAAFGLGLLLLQFLVVAAGLPKVPAQALAVLVAMPANFLGNRLWAFR
jgi:dolichol-phosphate mannosyltransferase